jgi:hypothetical protein
MKQMPSSFALVETRSTSNDHAKDQGRYCNMNDTKGSTDNHCLAQTMIAWIAQQALQP